MAGEEGTNAEGVPSVVGSVMESDRKESAKNRSPSQPIENTNEEGQDEKPKE